MDKLNCWQYKGCGREPGGSEAREKGICPAAMEIGAEGINSGEAAGRACWAVAGTMCGAQAQGTSAQELEDCESCDFLHVVREQEGDGFTMPDPIRS